MFLLNTSPDMPVYSVLSPICLCTQSRPHMSVYSVLTPYDRVLGPDPHMTMNWVLSPDMPRSLDRHCEVTETFKTWNFVGQPGL